MSSGYTMDVQQTKSAATALSDDATFATTAKSNLTGMPVPGAPAAGDGIGSTLAPFKSGWTDVLDKVGKELTAMSGKVIQTANVTVTVEEQVHSRFSMFAI